MTAQYIRRQLVAHGTMCALLRSVGRSDMAEMEIAKMMTCIMDRGSVAGQQGVMS